MKPPEIEPKGDAAKPAASPTLEDLTSLTSWNGNGALSATVSATWLPAATPASTSSAPEAPEKPVWSGILLTIWTSPTTTTPAT